MKAIHLKPSATLLIILAGVSWSFAGVFSKQMPWSALSLVGFRSVPAALILGLSRGSFRIVNNRPTWMGALFALLTALLFMLANKLTSAANAIVLQYAMPMFVIAASALIYHQKPKARDAVAALIVLMGVALCFYEGLGDGKPLGDGIALLSAVTWAAVFLAARMPGCDALAFTYQSCLLGCLFLIAIPFDPKFTLAPTHWLIGAGMGVCLGLGYMFFSLGMRAGISPVAAAVVSNVEPVLNPTWVFLVLGENPGAWSIAGAAVVLAAVTIYGVMQGRTKQTASR